MLINEIRKIVGDIKGFLTNKEGEALFNLAKKCQGNGAIVEIGSWTGTSTIWLASGSKEGNKAKIYAIDPHTGSSENQKEGVKIWTFEEFRKNIKIAKVDDMIIPIVKTSEEVAKDFDKPVELIFIDGAHEYEFVKMDFNLWFPKVIDGGIMAFHDTTSDWSGAKKLVNDEVYKSRYFKDIKLVDSITFAQKVNKNSLKDIVRNRCVFYFKNLYEFASKLNLPKPIKIIGKKIVAMILRN